jgi:hypothetical protein
MKTKLSLLSLFVVLVSFTSAQSTFDVTFYDAPTELETAMDYATDIWSGYLNSEVPIKVNLYYMNLTSFGPLGQCIPNGAINFLSAEVSDVWYATSLANSIEGSELNPDEADMNIFMNSSVNFYFGTDGNLGTGQMDFVSVVLHEIVHGLGGVSLAKYSSGSGSLGEITASDFAPISTSFPFPDLDGYPSIWDSFIANGNGESIIDTDIFTNPSTELGSAFVSGDLHFIGAGATSGNNNLSPKIFAPGSFQFGSSIHHFDEATFPNSTGNGLFTPSIANGQVVHEPGLALLGALADIGWSVNQPVAINEEQLGPISVYPNPVQDQLIVQLAGHQTSGILTVFSAEGQLIEKHLLNSPSLLIDCSHWAQGMYVLQLESAECNEQVRIVRM